MNDEAADRRLRWLFERWNEIDQEMTDIVNMVASMFSESEAERLDRLADERREIEREIIELSPQDPSDDIPF